MSFSLAAGLARRTSITAGSSPGTTFLTMLATAGALGAPGVMIVPLQKEFGWQTADISSPWRSASCSSASSARSRPRS